ncbi:MAG: hypothetical protein IKZ72_06090 [Bacteroidales bacterium]|nr:hypothetical protein [Bacteroidales bacterium]
MNNVFDIKRFGRYFAYDLNNARNNFGVSALTVGLLPLILLFFNTLFGLVFTGDVPQVALPAKVVILVFAFIIVAISGPVKLYGHLTERRSGSDWLMIPASSFEKFLSMALMLCIVLPVAVLGLFSICDLLLSWIVPVYGDSVVRQLGSGLDKLADIDNVSVMFLSPGGTVVSTWLNWCVGILPFALGAICFKKGKAAKTILCLIGFNMLLSLIIAVIFKSVDMSNFETFFENLTADNAGFWVNFFINAFYFVVVGGMLTALYFRVRTIKH